MTNEYQIRKRDAHSNVVVASGFQNDDEDDDATPRNYPIFSFEARHKIYEITLLGFPAIFRHTIVANVLALRSHCFAHSNWKFRSPLIESATKEFNIVYPERTIERNKEGKKNQNDLRQTNTKRVIKIRHLRILSISPPPKCSLLKNNLKEWKLFNFLLYWREGREEDERPIHRCLKNDHWRYYFFIIRTVAISTGLRRKFYRTQKERKFSECN